MIDDISTAELAQHYDVHELRTCDQAIFTQADDFARHLELTHKVDFSFLEQCGLKAWQRVQFLEIIDGKGLIRTSRVPYGDSCCSYTETSYNFTFVLV